MTTNRQEHKKMYTIEQAKFSGLQASYNIPHDAVREFGRDNIERAIRAEVKAAKVKRIDKLRTAFAGGWQKLTGTAHDRAYTQAVNLPTQPEATR
jgi:hypothetical protein